MNLDQFVIFVENLPGMLNLGPVIAATRRGANQSFSSLAFPGSVFSTGVLNLEATPDRAVAQAAIDRVARLAHGDFAVKLDAYLETTGELIAALPQSASTIILTGALNAGFAAFAAALKKSGRRVLAEVTSSEELQAALAASADGRRRPLATALRRSAGVHRTGLVQVVDFEHQLYRSNAANRVGRKDAQT